MPQSLPLPFPEPLPTPPPAASVEAARSQSVRSWAAIHLSALALEALGKSETSAQAIVLVEGRAPKAAVLALSAGARAAGIETGMTAAAACARVGDLKLMVRDPARETAVLNRLAAWSQQFTSTVSLEPPDTLLLDIGGSLKLFGGMAALQAQIRNGLDAQGYTANLALAPTPRAALWLAQTKTDVRVEQIDQISTAVGALPLSTLSLPDRSARRFNRLGVKTLRQAFRLPRDGLAKRFGPELLRDWDRALGQAPEPRRHWQADARFVAERDFPDACESLGRIEPLIDGLIAEMAVALQRHDAGIDIFALLFRHEDQAPTRLVLRLLDVSRDAARLKRLAHTRLERFVLPAPAIAVRLVSSAYKMLAPDALALPGLQTAPAPESDSLVETLCARLGRQAVFGLAPVADHRPESAWQKVAPGEQPAAPNGSASAASAPRPFWLLAAPQPLQLHEDKPLYRGRALQPQGPPERIEGGWWEAADLGRDYYRVRANNGAWLWIYREHGARGWFLHGYFA